MSTKKKLLQAAAGNAGGASLNVEDVFSTTLYTGNNSARTITNGINLSDEGGMLWIKNRGVEYHSITDTTQTYDSTYFAYPRSFTNTNSAYGAHSSGGVSSFNVDGFSINTGNGEWNASGNEYTSWTFRKAPKFFDVVGGLTSDSSGNLASFNHSLGSTPGMVILKSTSSGSNWLVYHRGLNGSGANQYMYMQSTDSAYTNVGWATATDTTFTVNSGSLLVPSVSYVAYLFAHNDGDGEFGLNGDQDIIKCGSVVTDGSGNASVDVGFEPQWVFWKCADALGGNEHGNWRVNDVLRGWPSSAKSSVFGYPSTLYSNTTDSESINGVDGFIESSTGFGFGQVQASKKYIYVAIRKGTKIPESATEVFQPHLYTGNGSTRLYDLDITPDMVINISRNINGDARAVNDRLRQLNYALEMYTNGTGGDYNAGSGNAVEFDYTDKIKVQSYRISNNQPYINYAFKRAPSFFDIVAYKGNSVAGRGIKHNLGVAPEMIWVKNRDTSGYQFIVWHKDFVNNNGILYLNSTSAEATDGQWSTTLPDENYWYTGPNYALYHNDAADYYIAYLFASLDGVSKVGSYTGNGSSSIINVDCGFSAGARFVLIRRIDSNASDGFYVFDSARGINDNTTDEPYILLNNSAPESTSTNYLTTNSSGFGVSTYGGSPVNVSGGSYVFYAIA